MSRAIKLPVFDTVVEAFKYPVVHFGQLVKVFALPTLFIYGPMIALTWCLSGGQWPTLFSSVSLSIEAGSMDAGEVSPLGNTASSTSWLNFLFQVVGLVFTAMISVPLTRAIVAGEKPGFFRLDRHVWWYVLGQIVFFLAIAIIILAGIAATAGLVTHLGTKPDSEMAIIGASVFGTLVTAMVLIRLAMFLPEVAMSGRPGFWAIYSMTRGNVWRLVGLALLLTLATIALITVFCVILLGLGAFLLGGDIVQITAASTNGDPQVMLALLQDMLMSPAGGILAALYLAMRAYTTGVSIALPALIYKALEGNRKGPA